MKLTTAAVERMSCVDAVQVAEACDALLARLRRIAQVASAPPGDKRPPLSEARAAHTASAEALLNLLSVLREDGTQGAAVLRLEAGLAKVLDGAPRWFSASPVPRTE